VDIIEKLGLIIEDVKLINEENIDKSLRNGEQFNLIKLLKMGTSEVHTHTPIIADLLNPKGSHGQGKIFLREFINFFDINFNLNDVIIVEREFRDNKDQIDILIENSEKIIIIENKIYASDQKDQLYRYYTYCIGKNKVPILIYLTMNNKKPSKYSLGKIKLQDDGFYLVEDESKKNVDMLLLNYHEDLIGWLNEISLLATDKHNIKSGIDQYKNLILQMTGQVMSNEQAIKKLMLESDIEKLKAIIDLMKIFQQRSFRGEMLYKFFDAINKNFEMNGYHICNDERYNKAKFSLKKCDYWFVNVNKEKRLSRDFVGCFFNHELNIDLVFFIIVATDVLYYGFFSDKHDDEILNKIASESNFIKKSNNNKLGMYWFGKSIGNVRAFDKNVLNFLVVEDNVRFDELMKQIISDFERMLSNLSNPIYS
jgi:hypothetical protein